MANKPETTQHINIAVMGDNHYARHGIETLLRSMKLDSQIITSVANYQNLDKALSSTHIDILMLSGAEKHSMGYGCLKNIKKIKADYPNVIICMYSTSANSLLWVRGDIDAYISLQDPIYQWRTKLLKMVDSRYRPQKRPAALSLTPGEWRVLKELRNGLDIRYIAELEKLSYRRVSALKSSAIRKLGLRNKTDLLVFLTS
ncbi:LuxR C-terminal-related transcriptional regulator [Enterobacter sp. UNJFSC 003]|uniref:LuxR C-terminal-related transcriptional regulator n=1 Tax=Enterobacter sp. UNJFSC 003 TaxID=3122077 RepID=UPI002EC49E18|nr:LuxR C-terminal-related transcriptional regulator [Serratia liquefaciens]